MSFPRSAAVPSGAASINRGLVSPIVTTGKRREKPFDPAALVVIHRGIDERFLAVGAKRSPTSRERPVRILCVGRLVPDKGALVLAEAFIRLGRQVPGVDLHFYGDADEGYERQLRQECEKHGLLDRQIFIHGAVPSDRMPEIYEK